MEEEPKIKCEYCGETCEDDWELEVYHRGCRLKAAFPDCYKQDGPLLEFDVKKIAEKLEMGKPPSTDK